jgi:hypothetical protein
MEKWLEGLDGCGPSGFEGPVPLLHGRTTTGFHRNPGQPENHGNPVSQCDVVYIPAPPAGASSSSMNGLRSATRVR